MKNKKNFIIYFLFVFGYLCLLVTDVCTSIKFVSKNETIITLIGYILIITFSLINILRKKSIQKKHLFLLTIAFFLSIISYMFCKNFTVIRLLLLIIAVYTVPFDKMIYIDLILKAAITLLLIILPSLGLMKGNILLRSDLSIRNAYGFMHPNTLCIYLTCIFFDLAYIIFKIKNSKKSKITLLVIAAILISLIYKGTDSRMSFIILSMFYIYLILLTFFSKKMQKLQEKNFYRNMLKYAFPFFTGITIITVFGCKYNHEFLSFMDKVFSNRYSNYLIYIEKIGFSLFGKNVPIVFENAFLDNMYLKLFLNFGIFVYFIYLFCYHYSIDKIIKEKNYFLGIIIFLTTLQGLTETNMIMPTINIYMFYFAYNLINDNKQLIVENEVINKVKKRILVFGITENPGGVESVIMNYYRNIDRDKIQFDFLCNTDKVAYEDEIKKLGGKIYRITPRSKNIKKYKKEMNEFFRKNSKKYNTIWVNVCSLANIDYLKYAKKYGIKYRIIHSHNSQNMDSKIRGLLHKFNKRNIEKYATDFWTCGEEAGKWFYDDKIINSEKYLLVNNAIDSNKFKFSEKTRKEYRKKLKIDDKFVIGHVGRFHFQKNHPFVIKVFNEIQKKVPNSVLLLIGAGEDENKIKELVDEYKLNDKVKFLGLRNDVEKIMCAMDIFLFPSLFEGLPVVLIESQLSDLLIYSSDNISPNSKITNKINMISLDKNEKYWANKIIKDFKKDNKRSDKSKEIKQAGYDIANESKKLQHYFERN